MSSSPWTDVGIFGGKEKKTSGNTVTAAIKEGNVKTCMEKNGALEFRKKRQPGVQGGETEALEPENSYIEKICTPSEGFRRERETAGSGMFQEEKTNVFA